MAADFVLCCQSYVFYSNSTDPDPHPVSHNHIIQNQPLLQLLFTEVNISCTLCLLGGNSPGYLFKSLVSLSQVAAGELPAGKLLP